MIPDSFFPAPLGFPKSRLCGFFFSAKPLIAKSLIHHSLVILQTRGEQEMLFSFTVDISLYDAIIFGYTAAALIGPNSDF